MLNSFVLRVFFRIAYWFISTIDKKGEVTFMNYGYFEKDKNIDLDLEEEKNRYAIQLYHHLATSIDVSNKDILEIGSGRGGGLNFICKNLNPKSATGVDLNEKAVRFCNDQYKNERIKFIHSDAEDLNLKEAAFDIVINIESSHGYPHMDRFLSEVYRVLKPGGYFLFADFRPQSELISLKQKLIESNLVMIREAIITENVLDALKLIHDQRSAQIKNLVPKIFQGMSRNFAGLDGTPIFNKFVKHEFEYVFYMLRK